MTQYLCPRTSQKGFSTLEILIAMFLLVLMLTAVVTLSFGNQAMIADSRSNAEALNIAQGLLEKAQADSRKDFNLVNPLAATTTADNFTYRVDVAQQDNFTKLVTAAVEFPEDSSRHGNILLSTLVTNFNNAVGGDTGNSVLLPDAAHWDVPEQKNIFSDFSSLTGVADNYPVTDVDAYRGKLYVTVGKTSAATTSTFFIFNINDNDPDDPKLEALGNVDNDPSRLTGLNAVAVAEDPSTGITYAYVASASNINKQLQIIDVSANPPQVVKSVEVVGDAHGNSLFYKNGYIYLGLKAASGTSEFSIIDVHKPLLAGEVGHWPVAGGLGHDINSIYVKGNYAYLATADDRNLIILDISNASFPVEIGNFNMQVADGSDNHGKSLAMVGDSLYLGRTKVIAGTDGAKFYIFNIIDPATTTLSALGSYSGSVQSVDGIIVRGKSEFNMSASLPALAFVLTPVEIKILDVSNPVSISQRGTMPLASGTYGSPVYEPVFDGEGNYLFIGSTDGSKNGYLSIIVPRAL
jgi:Tfp pilus assembly protein PilV